MLLQDELLIIIFQAKSLNHIYNINTRLRKYYSFDINKLLMNIINEA